jgi:hypothetical protein
MHLVYLLMLAVGLGRVTADDLRSHFAEETVGLLGAATTHHGVKNIAARCGKASSSCQLVRRVNPKLRTHNICSVRRGMRSCALDECFAGRLRQQQHAHSV